MRRIWLFLWLALLVTQVLTFWLSGRAKPPVPLAGGPLQAELLGLARLTNEQWAGLAEVGRPAQPEAMSGDGATALLQREECLLALRDLESRLSQLGADVKVAADAQAWIAGRPAGAGASALLNRYLQGLSRWLEPFLEEDSQPLLRRASLQPGPAEFPSLYFEFSGDPRRVGERLLRHGDPGGAWQLCDLELFRPDPSADWWMLGSYAFLARTQP